MLDPVMLCLFVPRQLHWLTRSDVFRIKPVRAILTRFNMLPVYRDRDKHRFPDWSHRNTVIFNICHERLKNGAAICLFPEGTHRGKKQLHLPLKKGAARLAFSAIEAGVDPQRLRIVPVGLDYSDYFNSRADLLIRIGKPVPLRDIAEKTTESPALLSAELTDRIREALLKEMIDIRAGQDYDEYIGLRDLCDVISPDPSLDRQFTFYKNVIQYLHDQASDQDRAFVRTYIQKTHELSLHEEGAAFAEASRTKRIGMAVLLIFTFPVFAAARIIYLPVHAFVEWFVSTRVTDPLFYNSIRMTFWTFLFPFWSAILLLTSATWFSTEFTLGIAILLTGGGWLALKWMEGFRMLRRGRRVRILEASHSPEMTAWRSMRNDMIRLIEHWNEKAN